MNVYTELLIKAVYFVAILCVCVVLDMRVVAKCHALDACVYALPFNKYVYA